MSLLPRTNIVLSENSWNDVVNKYNLYRELEVVIRESDDTSLLSTSVRSAMPRNSRSIAWAYRSALVVGAFSVFGNIPVQSHLLASANNNSTFGAIAYNQTSFITTNKSLKPLRDNTPTTNLVAMEGLDALKLTLPERAIATYAGHSTNDTKTKWKTYHVKSYDNLTNIFHKIGHQKALSTLKADSEIYKELKTFNTNGSLVRASSDEKGKLSQLVFTKDNKSSFVITLNNNKYAGSWEKNIFEIRQARASFTIKNGLFFDGRKAGIENKIIRQIVKVFDWDIDFSHDIRVGDKITAVFEEIYHDGDNVASKHLLAAEFINKNRVLRTVHYTFADGKSDYFTPDGREMKKAFIRTPISHARVSSHFNPGRLHPVLHKFRAHKGTDFASRSGTPIMTTGNGIIKSIGRKGGYGRTIVVQHREGYTTIYAHMSKYKKGLKKGDKVYQTDIIGYVGSSGLATGPHLHYEIRKNNKPMDAMRASLPNSMSLSPKELQDFRNKAINLVLQLNVLHRFVEANIEIDSSIGG